jgi:lipopolysaccharide transport system permease protein
MSPSIEQPTGRWRVLQPRTAWQGPDWSRLWASRELLLQLAWRDVQVRYKQTMLGAAWAVLQPLLMMVVLSVIFGRLVNLQAQVGEAPYAVFCFAGMLPWAFFAAVVAGSSQSLVNSAAMLRKIYFPRLVLPIAAAGAPLVDLVVSLTVLGGLMAWYAIAPSPAVLLIPLLVLLAGAAALAVGIALAAVTVTYRDFRHVVPFLLQVWFFLTPVIYPVTVLPAEHRWLLTLNPMTAVTQGFRAAILQEPMPWATLLPAAVVVSVALIVSVAYFQQTERRFADVV